MGYCWKMPVMEITPLNYCSKAIINLEAQAKFYEHYPDTHKTLNIVIKLLKESVKFLLPNCGELLDIDNFNQGHHDLLKMPYPLTAFEAPWKKETSNIAAPIHENVGELLSEKRIALAIESDCDAIKDLPHFSYLSESFSAEGGVFILPISEIAGNFMLLSSGCFLPYGKKLKWQGDEKTELSRRVEQDLDRKFGINQKNARIPTEIVAILPELVHETIRHLGQAEAELLAFTDSRDEAQMILQACAVMNCENIEIQDLPTNHKLNKSRLKKGKLPFFEYKILGIGEDSYKRTNHNSNSGDSKKRMHLRRGHLRRLETGKTTWVRNSVINPGEKKVIEKAYKLKSK